MPLTRILKSLRRTRPVDWLVRTSEDRQHLPPIDLQDKVGDFRAFESQGREYYLYLRLFCHLKPDARVLDVGCGPGRIALALSIYLNEQGSYEGIEIIPSLVDWARTHITPEHPNFRFHQADIYNKHYHPRGRLRPEEYTFPVEPGFDQVLFVSVLTHLQTPAVEQYIRETARILRPGGLCLASFLLLNEAQKQLEQQGKLTIPLDHGSPEERLYSRDVPEIAVAYPEEKILALFARFGLELDRPILYGTWSGREDGLSCQDLVVVRKKE